MKRRPPRTTQSRSVAASDVDKGQDFGPGFLIIINLKIKWVANLVKSAKAKTLKPAKAKTLKPAKAKTCSRPPKKVNRLITCLLVVMKNCCSGRSVSKKRQKTTVLLWLVQFYKWNRPATRNICFCRIITGVRNR